MDRAEVIYDTATDVEGLALKPGENLVNGIGPFSSLFKNVSSLEVDLLNTISAIYACDLAFKRGEREEIIRNINLRIPVVNIGAFQPIAASLRLALYKVSHDSWNVEFIQKNGEIESKSLEWPIHNHGKVLLFSGGLDSFSAAAQFGEEGESVKLVAHVTHNQTVSSAQEALYQYLSAKYEKQFEYLPFRIFGRNRRARDLYFPTMNVREDSQRTRSVLFLGLAALVARRNGISEIVVIAENGQMAIHLPLTSARISAFSTYTAHPEFIRIISKVFSDILNFRIHMVNPFEYSTKREVVQQVANDDLIAVSRAVSCWRSSRIADKNHCGICIPCIIRRISIESNGVTLDEYKRDIFREDLSRLDENDIGKRNLVDLLEFIQFFSEDRETAVCIDQYPELINPDIDATSAIAMYKRFANEALNLFAAYPLVAQYLE